MNLVLLQLIPMVAGGVGVGFLYQLYRDGKTRSARRILSNEEYWEQLEPLEERWPMRVRGQAGEGGKSTGFDTLDSALTLSFAVVCLEAISYMVYLSVTSPAGETGFGVLKPLQQNVLCYVGLTVVLVAGLVRVKKLWK